MTSKDYNQVEHDSHSSCLSLISYRPHDSQLLFLISMLRYIIAFLFFAACSVDIFAAIQVVPPTTTSLPYTDATGNPGSIIANVIRYAIMLTGVLAVMAITWGGIGMVLAV